MNDIVVIGPDHYNTLGIVRSLGEKGIRSNVFIYTNGSKSSFVLTSKYVNKGFIYEKCDEQIITDIIEKYTNLKEPTVVIVTSDIACLMVDRNLKKLTNFIISSCRNKEGSISEWMDKSKMNYQANKVGLEIPNSIFVKKNEDVDVNSIVFPCIVKPLESAYGNKSDITICRTGEEFVAVYDVFKKQNIDILIQDYIEAEYEIGLMGYSYFNSKKVWLPDIIFKRRFSNKSAVFSEVHSSEALPEYKDLISRVRKLVLSIEYTGIFDVDFVCSHGKIYFIEMNLRNGAYGYGLSRAGTNFAYTFAKESCKQDFELGSIVNVSYIMCEFSDFKQCHRNGINLFIWLKDFFRSTHMVIQFQDWKPVLAYIRSKIK